MKSIFQQISLALLFVMSASVHADDATDLKNANQAYFQNRLEEAGSLYEGVLSRHPDSADILYNLGNVAFRKSETGKAIWYYQRALRLKPRDADLRANLKFAINKRLETFEAGASWEKPVQSIFAFADYLTDNELKAVLAVALAFFWILLLLGRWFKQPTVKTVTVLMAVISVVLSLGLWFKLSLHPQGEEGVVLQAEVEVRPSFLEPTVTVLKLHEGSQVRILGEQKTSEAETWYQIALPQGRKGWVQSRQIGMY